ncbi:MAG: hypothetical protein ACPG1B_06995 [Ilumatobacteraceae bacterium]|nr:hypothetical protein [Actinomycetota bacterium]|tara:strand:- start:666 stop:863 length:198 start_codon:yes stop_codon:yes gene_type:complete
MTESSANSTAVLDETELLDGSGLTIDAAAAIAVIDESLVRLTQRELVSANEVTDVLLDVRRLLAG